jgi:VanZ family protein
MKERLYFIPPIIIMILIYLGSNDPASGEKSDFITKFIWKLIDNIFRHNHTYSQEMGLSFLIRKLAHMTEYGLLNISIFFALIKNFNLKYGHYIIISSTISLLYSITDEYHQSFVPGRVGTYEDVLIDLSGILLVSFILIKKLTVKNV